MLICGIVGDFFNLQPYNEEKHFVIVLDNPFRIIFFQEHIPEIKYRYLSLTALLVFSDLKDLLKALFLLVFVAEYTISLLPMFPWTYFQTSGPYCLL